MKIEKISSVLKKKMAISTMLNSSCVWKPNIIEKVSKNTIYISLLDSYVSSLIMQGTNMSIKYSTEYYEYIFDGIVSKISLDKPKYVAITINKIDKKINTRAFTRYDIYLPSNIKLGTGKTSYFTIITNISLKGMSFTTNHEFNFDDLCDVCIHLPNNEIINLNGRIKRKIKKDKFLDYGMHFEDISKSDTKTLSEYILSIKNGDSKLQTPFFDEN
ncbi:MAG: PilZ domain-containing protein [Clostridiales bacterium]